MPPAKKEPEPPKDPWDAHETLDVASMSCAQLLDRIKVAVGNVALSICDQASWTEEDVDQLGKCARVLCAIARVTDGDDDDGKKPGDASDDEVRRRAAQ